MTAYILVSMAAGIVSGVLDGPIHTNPATVGLFSSFEPIAERPSMCQWDW
ncbi:hypothetical protein [Leptolinea tardivitalis]|nr:hypothetical protein [Leptolinea tardivitalis]GAP20422.1 hypothetical protein LTAR_00611 [Leptolinea tardivitalis]